MPTRPRRLVLGAVASGLLTIALCLLLLWGNPRLFFNDDYAISILPVLTDVARSWHEGHWPLLSPYGWACGNLAGEYQYGTFSVFLNAVVVAVWQWPLTFPNQAAALSITHLAVMAAGAFLLARGRRLPTPTATGVALVAALNGWMIGWGATNWFGALAAEAWLPWCWWAFEAAMRPGAGRKRRWMLPAPFVYLLLTGGFPYTVVMLGLVTARLAVRAVSGGRWRALGPLAAGWGLGLGLAAPAWLSLLTYMAGSKRSSGAGVEHSAWTVPLSAWPGLILPDWTTAWHDFGNHPSTHAALELSGALVPVVALAAALAWRRRALWRAVRWELGLLGVVMLLCVLPSPGVFRWSFRWLPLFHLVLALTGGRAMTLVLTARRRHCLKRNPGTWAFALVAAVWILMAVLHTDNADALTRNLPWLTLIVAALWMLAHACLARRRTWAMWLPTAVVFVTLLMTYRHMYTNPGLPVYAFGPALTRVEPLSPDRLYVSFYREPDRTFRSWQTVPDFGAVLRPGSTSMYAGVRFINAYSPIMAQGIGRRLSMETHGNIPDDLAENIRRNETGPSGLLARLGVDGLLIARDYYPLAAPPPPDEWEEVYTSTEGAVYHRRGGPQPEIRSWAAATPVRVDDIRSSRQEASAQVEVPANGTPGVLAFRRPYFPGYVASLDGKTLPVTSYQGLLPTVELPPGSHGRLTLRYRPRAVTWGAVSAGLSLLTLLLVTALPTAGSVRFPARR